MADKWIPQDPFSKASVHEWEAALELGSTMEARYRAVQAVYALSDGVRRENSLIKALADEDPTVRVLAARLLGKLALKAASGDDLERMASAAGDKLRQLLDDADPDVRFESARTLIGLRQSSERVTALLTQMLAEPGASPSVIAAGIESMSHVVTTSPDLINAILPFSGDTHGEVREAVALAFSCLATCSGPVTSLALQLLDDEEPLAREYAARALGKTDSPTPAILAALEVAQGDEDFICAEAARSALLALTANGAGESSTGR